MPQKTPEKTLSTDVFSLGVFEIPPDRKLFAQQITPRVKQVYKPTKKTLQQKNRPQAYFFNSHERKEIFPPCLYWPGGKVAARVGLLPFLFLAESRKSARYLFLFRLFQTRQKKINGKLEKTWLKIHPSVNLN